MRFSAVSAIALTVCLGMAGPVSADQAGASAAKVHAGKAAKDVADNWAKAPIAEQDTHYTGKATVDGHKIEYTATAGTLTIRDDEGKPEASVFYTAYTAKGEHRPVTFFYNGGPGSASLWLRMGSFAPEAVMTKEPTTGGPAPFTSIKPNPDTLIGSTDMVFIDAVGTGYSRPLSGTKPEHFYGVDQDIDAFKRAIKRYITKNKRWDDPKYIFGESYGTTRSAGLVRALEDDGVQMNGVVLLSSILNYGILQSGYDNRYIGYLPTYAATAWYHDKIKNKPADLAAFVDKVRTFANGDYRLALAKGDDISDAEADKVAQELSAYTGLSEAYLKRTKLRIDPSRFRKELMRDEGETLGRFDGRFMGTDVDNAGERPEYDPSDTGISGTYVSGFMDRLTRKFGYKTELKYRLSARPYKGWTWDFGHEPPRGWKQKVADVAVDLSNAMRINPHLKVMSLNGYFDMATPFFSTELDLKHMGLPKKLQDNLSFHYYHAGHMVYLNPKARHQMRLDLQAFYKENAK